MSEKSKYHITLCSCFRVTSNVFIRKELDDLIENNLAKEISSETIIMPGNDGQKTRTYVSKVIEFHVLKDIVHVKHVLLPGSVVDPLYPIITKQYDKY